MGKTGTCPPWKMYKVRFASFKPFDSHEKNHNTRFTGSKYTHIAIAAEALPQTPLGELTAFPHTPSCI